MATFLVTFITFAINVSINYYESKHVQASVQQIHIQGGEINVRWWYYQMNTDINLTNNNGESISVSTPQPEYITETSISNQHQIQTITLKMERQLIVPHFIV